MEGNCCGHTPQCYGMMAVVLGAVLIANQLWFRYDIWVVLGALLVIKGIIKIAMPVCKCQKKESEAKKGRK